MVSHLYSDKHYMSD